MAILNSLVFMLRLLSKRYHRMVVRFLRNYHKNKLKVKLTQSKKVSCHHYCQNIELCKPHLPSSADCFHVLKDSCRSTWSLSNRGTLYQSSGNKHMVRNSSIVQDIVFASQC